MSENNQNKKIVISKETLIPLSLAITVFAVVWFVATLTATVNYTTIRVDNIEARLESLATKEDLKAMEKNLTAIFSK